MQPIDVVDDGAGEVASAEVAGGEVTGGKVTGGARGQSIQVRASVGAATRGPAMVETRALYAAADGALYRAKQAGRDRVAVAET